MEEGSLLVGMGERGGGKGGGKKYEKVGQEWEG